MPDGGGLLLVLRDVVALRLVLRDVPLLLVALGHASALLLLLGSGHLLLLPSIGHLLLLILAGDDLLLTDGDGLRFAWSCAICIFILTASSARRGMLVMIVSHMAASGSPGANVPSLRPVRSRQSMQPTAASTKLPSGVEDGLASGRITFSKTSAAWSLMPVTLPFVGSPIACRAVPPPLVVAALPEPPVTVPRPASAVPAAAVAPEAVAPAGLLPPCWLTLVDPGPETEPMITDGTSAGRVRPSADRSAVMTRP